MSNKTATKEVIEMTQEGHEKLLAELKRLRSEDRYEIAQRIEEARSFGDLSENAEYACAKDDQAKLEGRIQRLEYKLGNAKVLDSSSIDGSHVTLGTKVTIKDLELGKIFSYSIVSSEEADPKEKKISSISPVGQALMGKREGEEILVKVPHGMRKLQIIKIEVF